MTDNQPQAFNPEAMLNNMSILKDIIKRIRQKDGGVGSQDDELCLHRVVHDLDHLADMVAGLKVTLAKLHEEAKKEIAARDQRIKELETPSE